MANRYLLPLAVLMVLTFMLGIFSESNRIDKLHRVATFGLCAWCVVWLGVYFEEAKIVFKNRIIQSLGDASYTLYLNHIVLIKMLYFSGFMAWLGEQSFLLKELGFLVVLVCILRFSVEFYHVVEAPLYNRFRIKSAK